MTLLLTPRPEGGAQLVANGVVWATVYPYENKQGAQRWTAQTRRDAPCGRIKAPPFESEREALEWACAQCQVELVSG